MMAGRTLVPELLDDMPPDDPRAQGSRRDLDRINALMGNDRLVARLLGARSRGTILEIGAGDGRFMRRVARRLGPGSCVTLLDRQPSERIVWPSGGSVETVAADAFDYLERAEVGPFDAIVANLFLHHFEGARLAELLRRVAGKTSLFVACEPERSPIALAGTRMLGLIGCNDVTRHDAQASVRAGFRGREIAEIWPEGWTVEERAAPPFSHVFRAERRA